MNLTITELPVKRSWAAKGSKRPAKARKPLKTTPRTKKPRKTEIGLWREWLVPDNAYHRYKGLRGIFWYWLSRDVRQSEWEKWDKLCLTCLEPVENWEDGQCGHIVASAGCGEYLRFNKINLTLQHGHCNNPRFTPMGAALNAINYNLRHGTGAYEKLLTMRKIEAKEPRKSEYPDLIRSLSSYQSRLAKINLGTTENK